LATLTATLATALTATLATALAALTATLTTLALLVLVLIVLVHLVSSFVALSRCESGQPAKPWDVPEAAGQNSRPLERNPPLSGSSFWNPRVADPHAGHPQIRPLGRQGCASLH